MCRQLTLALLLLSGLLLESTQADDEATRPEWIWSTAERHDPQRVVLRRAFHIDGPVQRADLRLATEYASCELRVGGRTVLTLDDYGPWLDLDVTDHVRTGDNVLELHCMGSDGPSAVLLELVVTATDGDRTAIRSGADWKASARVANDSWQAASTFGAVAAEYWDADRTARITPFDNYEQWRQASGGEVTADPAKFLLRPGFEIERVRSAGKDEGSWVSLAVDPQGRLTIAREDKGLLRMTLAADGRSVTKVETIEDTLLECRGLLYAHDSLFAQANNSKAMYRLDDADGDGRFEAKLLRSFPGGVGHGRNDITLGPDDAIYAIFGDSVELPTENVIDFTSPFRDARRGRKTTEGHLLRYEPSSSQPETSQWQLLSAGLRNPFGIDFNADGEAFTYDADAEFDMGSPWYRPTRLVHLVAGGDYGWRGRTQEWPPYDADHADFTLPAGDIGKGSPTAVKSGQRSSFPEQYRRGMFVLDWAYGRIVACHLVPRGAGYVCRAESFLKGRPLNVTDLDFAPDGSMYLITGGRKTHSDLYRVRWAGQADGERASSTRTPQQVARQEFAAAQREVRRRLPRIDGRPSDLPTIDDVWSRLGDPDPMLRNAAQVTLENQPTDLWSERAFAETRPTWVVTAMLSLARSDRDDLVARILTKLADLPLERLSGYDRSMLLEAWSRCLAKPVAKDASAYDATVSRIRDWYPDLSPTAIAPTGAGRSVNHQLALLAERLDIPELVPKTLELLAHSRTQQERLHAVFVLRNRRQGWTASARRTVFETLGELDRTAIGGQGMPGFLRRIREELTATLSDAEREALGELLKPGTEREPAGLSIERPLVKQWRASDLPELLGESSPKPDAERGRELFRIALCDRCHRANDLPGGVVGPDLTSLGGRFGRRDILLSILEPSRVVDEKYRNQQIATTDGQVIVGRVVTGGDYRSTKLRLAPDPLKPSHIIEVDKSDIETHQPSKQSPMPAGLLDTFTPTEIRDLLAYLQATGR